MKRFPPLNHQQTIRPQRHPTPRHGSRRRLAPGGLPRAPQTDPHRSTPAAKPTTSCTKPYEPSKGRLAGFALIPMNEPAAVAAEELEPCVETLGFVGTSVNNDEKGRFYDDAFFWPVFAQCQVLEVPIYLVYPTVPGSSMVKGSGNYPHIVAQGPRYLLGLFDEHPKLKIFIGHMGEMLPFMLDRIIRFAKKQWPERQRGLQTVWDENLYITTAGMFSVAPMACLLRVCKIEHILYSVDYPFARNEEGKEYMHELSLSGLCSEEEMDMIAFGNAEALLGVKTLR
ncbi:MAG: hypothetical protein ASARMPREDX12_003334 [Alectoria sarmentosa]|nr:MAG: hypothetical protein ASARMPREDX12_003334 [Alectoria sarmentosa]